MKFTKEKTVLAVILLLATSVRFWRLSSIPNGFYIDEAAIGYNAYSLLLTGRDEWGKFLPIFLKSFDAYSSPLYAYLTTVPIKLFGLSIFSVRVLSAFSGVASVYVFYLLLKSIKVFKSKLSAYIGVFLFAMSPWSIFFSRGAYEANLALLLLLVSALLLIRATRDRSFLVLAFFVLGVSAYAYQAERLLSAVIVLGTNIYFATKPNSKKYLVWANILYFLVLTPQISLLFTKSFASRASGLFYSDLIVSESQKIMYLPSHVSKVLVLVREFLSRFMSYISPKNIFFSPDPDLQRSLPELSVLFPWMVIPFGYGLHVVYKNYNKYVLLSLLGALFISIPALTRDPFSTLRSLQLLPIYIFIITLGVDRLLSQKYKLTFLFVVVVLALSTISLCRSYFVLFRVERAEVWGYGYDQVASFALENPDRHIVIDTSRIKPPYILLTFYMKYPPAEFQRLNQYSGNYYGLDTKFDNTYEFANIETRTINWEEDIYVHQVLLGDALSTSVDQAAEHSLTKVLEVVSPTNKILFVGFETDPSSKCMAINFQNPHCASIDVR